MAAYEKRCKEKGFSAYFDYTWQWAYREKFEKAGLTALLGCGFDPGVTQAYCAYAKKHEFDTIDTIDILDCNGGDHGYPFATNFNPEVNLREVSARGAQVVAVCRESLAAKVRGQVDEVIAVPDADDLIAPLLAVIPLQLFAYGMAVARGCDVDKPRNLAKSVTVE